MEIIAEKYLDKLIEEVKSVLSNLCKDYKSLEMKNQKGTLCNINISFLRSSIASNTDLFRIDLYDAKHYADITPCYSYVSTQKIQEIILQKYPISFNKNTKEGVKKTLEIEYSILQDTESFFAFFETYLSENIDTLSCISPNVKFHYGEYYGDTVILGG